MSSLLNPQATQNFRSLACGDLVVSSTSSVQDPTAALQIANKEYVDYLGSIYMTANATNTVIGTAGTFVKVAGTTLAGTYISGFSNSDASNRLVYTGSATKSFSFIASLLVENATATTQAIKCGVAKNGIVLNSSVKSTSPIATTVQTNLTICGTVSLATGDYLEVFGTLGSASGNLLIPELTLVIN